MQRKIKAKRTPPKAAKPPAPPPTPITNPALLPALLTVPEVAQLLRRKPRSIYELVEKKAIPFKRPAKTRLIIFHRDEILEWSGYTKKPQP